MGKKVHTPSWTTSCLNSRFMMHCARESNESYTRHKGTGLLLLYQSKDPHILYEIILRKKSNSAFFGTVIFNELKFNFGE